MDELNTLKERLSLNVYYWVIGIVSMIALCVLPLYGSKVDIINNIPQTTIEWIVWSVSRVLVSGLNVLIFHCFVKQGDLNTREDKRRIQAEIDLSMHKEKKEYVPLSPKEFFKKEYSKKIPTLILGTALSLVALGPAVLSFDIQTLLTYLMVIIMGLVFGVIEMKKVENYYTLELPMYVEYLKKMGEKENDGIR